MGSTVPVPPVAPSPGKRANGRPASAFPQVRNYPVELPRLPVTTAKFLWSSLFVADFALGLTDKPDSEGDVVRKTEVPGRTGRAYRRLYERLFREAETHLADFDATEARPVPSVDAASFGARDFARWRRHGGSPLVLKGFLAGAPAVEEWSPEWLVENRGHVPTRCLDLSDPAWDGRKPSIGQNSFLYDVSLGDFLTKPRYERFYLNNYIGVFTDEDLDASCMGRELDRYRDQRRDLAQWFISRSQRTGTPLHCANADNLFLNIRGVKEWTFIHPSYSPVLLPALSRYGIYAVSELGEFSAKNREQRCAQYPHLRKIPRLVARLEAGDVLYNPPWYWHDVRNLSDFNIACAVRYVAHPSNFRSSPQFHVCQLLDAVRHPTRSFMTRGFAVRYLGKDPRSFIDSAFSRGSRMPADSGTESGNGG